MPSTILMVISGGQPLISGFITSGVILPVGGIILRNDKYSPSGQAVYVGLPYLSGVAVTINSGGTLSSGGLQDGWPLYPDEKVVIPKSRLQASGIGAQNIRLAGVAGASGARVFWDYDLRGD